MRHLIAPLLALASVASCDACTKAPPAAQADVVDGGGAPASLQAGQILAKVGNRTITLGDYAAALEHMDQFDRLRYQAPERRKELLSEMIDVMLLADEAREQGYDKDTETQQEVREILRDAVLKQVRESLPPPNDIPEADVRAYFEGHRGDFRDPERRRASAIVLPNAALATAVIDTLKEDPGAWGTLVRTRSTEPHAKAEVPPELAGDLGFVSPPGDSRGSNPSIPQQVRAVLFDIPRVGDYFPRPVQADGKAYVVKLAGKTDAHDRTFQDAARSIRVKLAQERVRTAEAALLDDLRKQYPVIIDEAAMSQVSVEGSDGGRE